MSHDHDERLETALTDAEGKLHERQAALGDALRALDCARLEVQEARDEVHALREALAMWLRSRQELRTPPRQSKDNP